MSTEIFEITDFSGLQLACQAAQSRYEERGKQVMTLQDVGKAVEARQRNTYWMWLGELEAMNLGYKKEELHIKFKKAFLIRILYESNPGYREFADLAADIQFKSEAQQQAFREKLIERTSITECNRNQLWQYMECVKHEVMVNNGLVLTMPEDLKERHARWLKKQKKN